MLDVILGAVNPSARFPVTVYDEGYLAQVRSLVACFV